MCRADPRTSRPLAEYPTFPGRDVIVVWHSFTAAPLDDIEHSEQPNDGIEPILTGLVYPKPIDDRCLQRRAVDVRPVGQPSEKLASSSTTAGLLSLAPGGAPKNAKLPLDISWVRFSDDSRSGFCEFSKASVERP